MWKGLPTIQPEFAVHAVRAANNEGAVHSCRLAVARGRSYRFAKTRNRVLDSLRDNAYGMYLTHYAFVSWLQYALLKTGLPAIAKGSVVFLGTVALSRSVTAALRRIPGVARIV